MLNLCNTCGPTGSSIGAGAPADSAADRHARPYEHHYDACRCSPIASPGTAAALLRESAALVPTAAPWHRRRAVAGPFLPPSLCEHSAPPRQGRKVTDYSALNAARPRLCRLGGARRSAGSTSATAPPRSRVGAPLGAAPVDMGNYNKGTLAAGASTPRSDRGSPADRILPGGTGHNLRDGTPRALARAAFADRLPAALLNERRKGYQSADCRGAQRRPRRAGGRAGAHRRLRGRPLDARHRQLGGLASNCRRPAGERGRHAHYRQALLRGVRSAISFARLRARTLALSLCAEAPPSCERSEAIRSACGPLDGHVAPSSQRRINQSLSRSSSCLRLPLATAGS